MALASDTDFSAARLFKVAVIVVCVCTTVPCTWFCTAVAMAVAFGRLLITMTGAALAPAAAAPAGGFEDAATAGVVGAAAGALFANAGAATGVLGSTLGACTPLPGALPVLAAGAALAPALLVLGDGIAPTAALTAFETALPNCAVDPLLVVLEEIAPVDCPAAPEEAAGAAVDTGAALLGAAAAFGWEFAAASAAPAAAPVLAGTVAVAAATAAAADAGTAAAVGAATAGIPWEFMTCTSCASGPDTEIVGIPPEARLSRFDMTIETSATSRPLTSTTRWIAKYATRPLISTPPRRLAST